MTQHAVSISAPSQHSQTGDAASSQRPQRPAIVCRLKPEGMAAAGSICGVCDKLATARYGFWYCSEHGRLWEEM